MPEGASGSDPIIPLSLANADELDCQLSEDMNQVKAAIESFLAARFNDAEAALTDGAHQSLYRSLGMGFLMFIKSLFTFDDGDISTAQFHLANATRLASEMQTIFKSVSLSDRLRRIFGRSSGSPEKKGTEKEPKPRCFNHAELIYAETHLISAILSVVTDSDGGWVLLMREAMNIRTSFLFYQRAFDDLACASPAESPDTDWESGVLLGMGLLNIMFSLLPPRVARLFEYLGYSGSISVGTDQLKAGAALTGSIRGPYCELALLLIYSVVSGSFAVVGKGRKAPRNAETESRDTRIELIQGILARCIDRHPTSPIYQFFQCRLLFMQHRTGEAVATLEAVLNEAKIPGMAQISEWPNFEHAFFWDILLGKMRMLQWPQVTHYAHMLANESRWSRAFCTYLEAISIYAINPQSDEILSLLSHLPKLTKQIAGRSIPMEKFVAERAKNVTLGKERLFIPHYELLLVWDNFTYLEEKSLEKVLDEVSAASLDPSTPDEVALIMLVRGAAKRALGEYEGSIAELRSIRDIKDLRSDGYAIPLAYVETALSLMEIGKRKEAFNEYKQAMELAHEKYALRKSIQLRLSKLKLDLDRGKH